MHLPLRAADAAWCKTTATDARAFYYNPGFIAGLSLSETQFVLAHEAVHCALGHFARRQHRERQRWDVACDHAANLLLEADGLKPMPGTLANPDFQGLSAEEIYPLIPSDTPERTLGPHLFDGEPGEHAVAGQSRGRAEPARGEGKGGSDRPADGLRPDSWDDAGDERRRGEGRGAAALPEAA